jgi:penicillin-binding protein 2
MPQRVPERIPPITPQLAWRVAVLGGLAFALFGIVFFRLWFLQVLSGQDYVSIARENRVRKVRIEAPRGDIVDANGAKLVTTKPAAVVQLLPNDLPDSVREQADDYRKQLAKAAGDAQQAEDRYKALRAQLDDEPGKDTKADKKDLEELKRQEKPRSVPIPPLPESEVALGKLYRRIARVLDDGTTPRAIHKRVIRSLADAAYSNVTIKTDVGTAEFNYIRENPELFPGVVVEKRFLRLYPKKDEAAQLFGTVSEITSEQRNSGLKRYAGIAQGTRIGQSGLEAKYDKYLRGRDGYTNVVVNAMGARDDQRKASVHEYVQGQRLKLTIDSNLEKAGDEALKQAISRAAGNGASAGAYVAMDPTNGAILAMGSQPSFDANVFARPFSKRTYQGLVSDRTSAPLLNRATESGYPTGSVFKPVTALAALQAGLTTPGEVYNDTGRFEYGKQKYQNAKAAVLGPVNMSDAIKKSSDIYFFRLGSLAVGHNYIQNWATKLGFGRRTGLDVPGESAGLVPSERWRNDAHAKYSACAKKAHVTEGTTAALFKCGGIERDWVGGDNVNLAVGQGDLQATPLQVAVAYSALANGGTIVRPHVGAAIEDSQGGDVEEFSVKARRKVKIDPGDLSVVRDGLRRAVQEPGGTSYEVFKDGWNMKQHPVYGKTGTAQRGNDPDQAWYACWVMDKARPIVVVVTIEKGGFGAETAAPAARLILDQWFATGDHEFHAGSSETN